jgi:hypothetical protein
MLKKLEYLFFFVLILVMPAERIYPEIDPLNLNRSSRPLSALKITSISEKEMIIEISVPDFQEENIFQKGKLFQKIKIPGFGFTAEKGKPMLPMKSTLLEIPEGSVIEVEVIKSEQAIKSNYNICPFPELETEEKEGVKFTIEKLTPDEKLYSTNSYFPDSLAQTGFYGKLREKNVVQLKFFPVQFNPVKKELIIHSKLWVKVKIWGGEFKTEKMQPLPKWMDERKEPFESIYQNLILNSSPSDMGYRSQDIFAPIETKSEAEKFISFPNAHKISIQEDGIYSLSYADLSNAGINLNLVNPQNIKIYNLGEEIPVHVQGEEDEVFDTSDYVEFYGLKNRSEYSNINIYWLTWEETPGKRMEKEDVPPGDSLTVPGCFLKSIHYEKDSVYYQNVYQGEGKSHWFWIRFLPTSFYSYEAQLNAVADTNLEASFRIGLRGKTDDPSVSPDHDTQIWISDSLVADIFWDGQRELDTLFFFPQKFLKEGENPILIKGISTVTPVNLYYLDWFEIRYWSKYQASDDLLEFSCPDSSKYQYELKGFPSDKIELFDVTDPQKVKYLTNYSSLFQDSTYTIKFEQTLPQKKEYIALNHKKTKKTPSIIKDQLSDLHATSNQADYIIITHPDFYSTIEPLKALRESEGLKVALVKVEDIYDEFNYGNFDPEAIKDFLSYAYHYWALPPPSYVLLVGDASYDYKGNLNQNLNFIPTHLFVSNDGEFTQIASDNWFVSVSGEDPLPDLLIGRFSGQTISDIQNMVNKTIFYEKNLPEDTTLGRWRKNLLFVADNPDAGGDFEWASDYISTYFVPSDYDTTKIYFSRYNQSSTWCKNDIIKNINNGCIIANYFGHGAVDTWGGEMFFISSDVNSLNNLSKYPLLIAWTCLNGYFCSATDDYCMAEEWVRAKDKGALACWAPTGLGYTFISEILAEGLYSSFFENSNYILGSSVLQSKIYLGLADDNIEMFTLFGDPATEMGFISRPDLLPSFLSLRPAIPIVGEKDTISVSIYNAGRKEASNILVRFAFEYGKSNFDTLGEITIPYLSARDSTLLKQVWDSPKDTGLYRIFVDVDPCDSILESNNLNNSLMETVTVVSVPLVLDSIPPEIKFFMNGKSYGSEFFDFDFAPTNPLMEANITDSNGIDTENIELKINDQEVNDFQLIPDQNKAKSVKLIYQPENLSDGEYHLFLKALDMSANKNSTQKELIFLVESKLSLKEVMNYPNPFKEQTNFTYILSQSAEEVLIKIYSLSGRLIKTIRSAQTNQNFNSIQWDGKDEDGDEVSNGVYIYKIIARDSGSRTDEVTEKLVIVR